jgi:Flp pilus assembly protein TadG
MTRAVASAASVTLLALMLIVPSTVSAAVPVLTDSWDVIPSTVKNGDFVAFRASIKNDDTSTVSQLFLDELVEDPTLTFVSISPSQGTCDTTGDKFLCTLGQLKPRRTATVTAIYQTPLTGSSATVRWEFNTTGLGSGGGDNSHGDSWPSGEGTTDLLTVALSNSDDFGGRYVLNSNLQIVENSQALNNANPHSTRAYAPTTGIGVTVEDIDCTDVPADPLCADLATGFGQISKVNVNDGLDVSGSAGTTLLHFYIQLDSSETPSGTNANNVVINHAYVDEATGLPDDELIDDACTFARKATIPNNAPCLTVKNLSGGDLGIDIWTFHNGGFKPGTR